MASYHLPGEHLYEGMVLLGGMSTEAIEQLRELEVATGDILVASYPKTGTTWMEEVLRLIKFDCDLEKAHHVNEKMIYLEYRLDTLKTLPRPCVIRTHLRAQIFKKSVTEGQLKVIVVIRNPKDTLVSLYNFYKMNARLGNFTGSWDEFFELYKIKHLVYGDFFDWYDSWAQYLDRPNVLLVKYEDMKRRMPEVIKSVSKFMGKSLTDDVIEKIVAHTTFDVMSSSKETNFEAVPVYNFNISPFLRKGTVGDWKNYFTEEQSKIVDKDYKERLANRLTLEFD